MQRRAGGLGLGLGLGDAWGAFCGALRREVTVRVEEELGLLGQERRASGELEVLVKLHRTRHPAAPGHGRLRDRPEGKQKFLQAAPGQRSLLPAPRSLLV